MKPYSALLVFFALLFGQISGLSAQVDSSRASMNTSSEQRQVESSGMQQFQSYPVVLNLDSIRTEIGYPEDAVLALIQGEVLVRVLVGINGEYKRAKLVRGVHPLLDDAVLAQLPYCRFSPAIMGNGKPCAFWLNIPFNFTLTE